MSEYIVNAMNDLHTNVSFSGGGGGGGGGGGRSSINQCTPSNPTGQFRDRYSSQVSAAPTRSTPPSTTGGSTACNIGRGLSAVGQAAEDARGRGGAIARGVGVVGEITASIACPRSGVTDW